MSHPQHRSLKRTPSLTYRQQRLEHRTPWMRNRERTPSRSSLIDSTPPFSSASPLAASTGSGPRPRHRRRLQLGMASLIGTPAKGQTHLPVRNLGERNHPLRRSSTVKKTTPSKDFTVAARGMSPSTSTRMTAHPANITDGQQVIFACQRHGHPVQPEQDLRPMESPRCQHAFTALWSDYVIARRRHFAQRVQQTRRVGGEGRSHQPGKPAIGEATDIRRCPSYRSPEDYRSHCSSLSRGDGQLASSTGNRACCTSILAAGEWLQEAPASGSQYSSSITAVRASST